MGERKKGTFTGVIFLPRKKRNFPPSTISPFSQIVSPASRGDTRCSECAPSPCVAATWKKLFHIPKTTIFLAHVCLFCEKKLTAAPAHKRPINKTLPFYLRRSRQVLELWELFFLLWGGAV